MSLKKYDNTIRDLKATFFDLFYEHTEELVGMIETLANDGVNDAVKIEAAIFQRIILLNKAAENIEHLMNNVDALDTIKGNGVAQIVSDGSKALVSEVLKTGVSELSNSNVVSAPVVEKSVAPGVSNVAVGNASVVQKAPTITETPVASTNDVSQVPVAVPTVPVSTSVQAPSVEEQKTPVVEKQATVDENLGSDNKNLPSDENNSTDVAKTLVEMAVGDGIPEVKNSPETIKKPTKFTKTGTGKVKAILVNDKQYEKLGSSCDEQFKLLSFDVSKDIAPSKEKIEKLMKKASTLYKEGKVAEAQALYSEISSLNKEINEAQGKSNVLIKKAA